ncbi:MAG: opacity family porin [Pseudomonadota bacterium]
MKTPKPILLAGTSLALALATPAVAQDLYVQGFAGYTFADNANFAGAIGGAPQSVFSDFEDGYNIGGSVGLKFAPSGSSVGFRGEVELSFGENDIDALNFTGNGPGFEVNVGGDVSATFLLVNGFIDFDTGSKLTPYLGGGIGVGFVDIDLIYGPGVVITGNDEVFAAQLIAGVSYEVGANTSIFGDVRYIQAYDVQGTRVSPGGAALVSDDLSRTALNVGVRFDF